jgi:hypothetical protein
MFKQITRDSNGNPRYVCHYSNLLSEAELADVSLPNRYNRALYNAKQFGGKKFHNKQFGGGIVFQSYNIADLEAKIKAAFDPEPESKIEWPEEVRVEWPEDNESCVDPRFTGYDDNND